MARGKSQQHTIRTREEVRRIIERETRAREEGNTPVCAVQVGGRLMVAAILLVRKASDRSTSVPTELSDPPLNPEVPRSCPCGPGEALSRLRNGG